MSVAEKESPFLGKICCRCTKPQNSQISKYHDLDKGSRTRQSSTYKLFIACVDGACVIKLPHGTGGGAKNEDNDW